MTTRLLILALFLLQPAWHLWLAPPTVLPPGFVVVVLSLPILPALLLAAFNRPSAGFWGGLAALFYFSHGVMEAWSERSVIALALIEVALSVALVLAASWHGLQARRAKVAVTPAGPAAQ